MSFLGLPDYLEGYILECESKPVGYGIISKTFSPEAGGVVILDRGALSA